MDIGDAVRAIRKERGMTQKKLAERSGLSANALCSIEKNVSFPSKETVKRICEALDIPVSYLLFFSISDEDVPADKLSIFQELKDPIRDILLRK